MRGQGELKRFLFPLRGFIRARLLAGESHLAGLGLGALQWPVAETGRGAPDGGGGGGGGSQLPLSLIPAQIRRRRQATQPVAPTQAPGAAAAAALRACRWSEKDCKLTVNNRKFETNSKCLVGQIDLIGGGEGFVQLVISK